MKNRKLPDSLRIILLAVPIAASFALASAASAQTYPPPAGVQAQAQFSQEDLDRMLAPIALYPDALLSQILMAATYPLEVAQAARWSRANPGLQGDQAVMATEQQVWDPSVKSLVAFPQILAMMDEKLEWTERLGDAFLAQESQVMDSVQQLRQRAYAAGTLRSDDRIRVESQGPAIMIVPADPQVFYVPYYDPTVVYGNWWWTQPPVYWSPWRGYRRQHQDFYFSWGAGIPVISGFFFGAFDWPARHTRVVNAHTYYYRRHPNPRGVNTAPNVWRHDPVYRRDAPYRDARVRQRFVIEHSPVNPRIAQPQTRVLDNRSNTVHRAPSIRSRVELHGARPVPRTQSGVRHFPAPALRRHHEAPRVRAPHPGAAHAPGSAKEPRQANRTGLRRDRGGKSRSGGRERRN
jgi:hypothetical protein